MASWLLQRPPTVGERHERYLVRVEGVMARPISHQHQVGRPPTEKIAIDRLATGPRSALRAASNANRGHREIFGP